MLNHYAACGLFCQYKRMQKSNLQNDWNPGTWELSELTIGYPLNTNMTGCSCFLIYLYVLELRTKVSLALEGFRVPLEIVSHTLQQDSNKNSRSLYLYYLRPASITRIHYFFYRLKLGLTYAIDAKNVLDKYFDGGKFLIMFLIVTLACTLFYNTKDNGVWIYLRIP